MSMLVLWPVIFWTVSAVVSGVQARRRPPLDRAGEDVGDDPEMIPVRCCAHGDIDAGKSHPRLEAIGDDPVPSAGRRS